MADLPSLPSAGRRTAWPALLLLGSALLAAGCYRPRTQAGPEVAPRLEGMAPDRRWPSRQGLRLHVFNTGENRVSRWLVGANARWRPVPAFAIEHPTEGLVVFDTGLGPEIARSAEGGLHPLTRLLFLTRSRPGLDLAAQMRAAGLDPDRVRTVILSHLHFDHVGDLEAFRNATFVVGRGALESSGSRMRGFAPSHTDAIAPSRWREIDFREAPPFATFDHGVDLFGDRSIVLVAGGGHTVGGLGALLALPDGPALLAGDLVVHRDWLWSDDVERIVVSPERAAAVRNRVRCLLELVPRLLLLPGHDLRGLPEHRADVVLHRPELFAARAWPIAGDAEEAPSLPPRRPEARGCAHARAEAAPRR